MFINERDRDKEKLRETETNTQRESEERLVWSSYHFPTGASVVPGIRATGVFTAGARQGQLTAATAAAWVDWRLHRQTQLAQTLGHRKSRLSVQLDILQDGFQRHH